MFFGLDSNQLAEETQEDPPAELQIIGLKERSSVDGTNMKGNQEQVSQVEGTKGTEIKFK